jgi:hypothetical protein
MIRMPDLPLSESGIAILSPAATAILREGGESAYGRLVVEGGADSKLSTALGALSPEQLFARPVKHPDDAAAALAGLWLWLDALDDCHKIAQDLVSPTGSFWHAIMHRREGDFSNAKYWYHRCPNHHVMKMLAAVSSSLAGGFESDRQVKRIISGPWSPDALVDLVEEVNEKPSDPRFDLAVKLQRAEWTGLFDYCVHAAVEADRDGLDAWDKRVNS